MYAMRKASRSLRQQPKSNNKETLRFTQGNNNFSGGKIIIITAWRYPGISPIREEIPIPAEILKELKEEGVLK
jgi:hypothetical protein